MQPVEVARHPAAVTETAQLLQVAAVQDIDGHVGVVADIEAALLFVFREVQGDGGADDVGVRADKLLGHETALAGRAGRIAAGLAQGRIVDVKDLNTIVSPVADIDLAVIGNLDAVHGVAEECRLSVAFDVVVNPCPRGGGRCVVNGIVSVSAEVADIFAGAGVNDQDAAISVAVRNIEAIGCGVHHHVRRLVEQRRAIHTSMGIVAVGSLVGVPQFLI